MHSGDIERLARMLLKIGLLGCKRDAWRRRCGFRHYLPLHDLGGRMGSRSAPRGGHHC